ncbi:Mov34/MPN/PAD-1 family protein [Myxococcota bacterium]|nr:Mov34/MPN/PAD-1 family protein [Myxococcota bacterium]
MSITREAFEEISAATLRGVAEEREFGGSLVALEASGKLVVTHAVPTGARADQGPGHVRTDADYQNMMLRRILARHPELRYVGDWHVHPMHLPRLSGTDLATAREMLLDPALARRSLLLMLGTPALRTGDPLVLAFRVELGFFRAVSVESLEVRVLDATSPVLRAAFPTGLASLAALAASDPREASAKHHDLGGSAPAGTARAAADVERVATQLGASASVSAGDDLLAAEFERGEHRALVVFPPEYPLGAPQVFRGSWQNGDLDPVPLLYGWSSLHSLSDVVEQALGHVKSGARIPPSPESSGDHAVGVSTKVLGAERGEP